MGKQDIEVYGLDPRTRAARVMVEADYRMKLVGMGLEEGVPGVISYLNSSSSRPARHRRRWACSAGGSRSTTTPSVLPRPPGLRHPRPGREGRKRKRAPLRRRRAGSHRRVRRPEPPVRPQFHRAFRRPLRKYPIYGELRNLCDLALAAALVREEGLADKVGWHLTCFGDPQAYTVELGEAPKEVETVVNCRVVSRRTILAGVSGGVRVHPASLVRRQAMEITQIRSSSGSTAAKQARHRPLVVGLNHESNRLRSWHGDPLAGSIARKARPPRIVCATVWWGLLHSPHPTQGRCSTTATTQVAVLPV